MVHVNCNNYFNTGDKSLCSGCAACQQACPFDALSMQPDEEGFLFPVKNLDKCTNCGLCERICPFNKPIYKNEPQSFFGCYSKDSKERKQSSSGALFYILAKYVIDNGGVVAGAYLSSELKVRHIIVSDLKDLNLLRGSKYVQSNPGDIYKVIRNLLQQGTLVYFCGTGCQVAGLKAFLRTDYSNLITSDLVCHGVPSQYLFDLHINYMANRLGDIIVDYKFRDDENWGVCETIITSKGGAFKKPSYILSPYLNSFIKGLTFRYSCYNCPYAHIPRQGDLTLADLWGVKKIAPTLNPKHGVSFVMINSAMGEKLWQNIKSEIELKEVQLAKVMNYNYNLAYPSKMPKLRPFVFEIVKTKGYAYAAKTIFKASLKEIIFMYGRRYLKKILICIGVLR